MRFREQQEQALAATRWLVLLFVLTVLLTVLGVNAALALAWRLQFGGLFAYPRWFFETNTAVTLGFVLGGAWLEWLQLRDGGAHVARLVGGREVTQPQTLAERRLRNIVDEMAIASGLPPPRIFVLDREDAINAFAAGWEPGDSVITVTRGALERLTRDELEGVVAHEFAHLLHGDTLLNMRLIGMVYGLQMVFTFGRSLMTPVDDRGRRAPTWLAGLALVVAGSIGWFGGRVLKAGVSREREYLADASAVQFTRLPQGLGNALRKVQAQAARGECIGDVNAELLSHLFLSAEAAGAGRWLATHPPLAERVRRLFGHDMPPLADDPLPVDDTKPADLPPLAFAAGGDAAPEPVPTPAADTPQAALPNELAELSAMAGPHVLEAAVLACCLAPDAPATAWQRAAGAAPQADRIVAAVRSLPPGARLPWLEQLAERAASLDAEHRAALLHRAGELVQVDGRVSLPDALRLRVLRRQLLLAAAPTATGAAPATMTDLADAIGAITFDLATLLPPQRAAWTGAVLHGLALPAPADATPARNLGPMLERLALLARLQRPALVKQWIGAVGAAPLPLPFAEAVRCVCVLIDTPLPPELAAAFEPVPLAAQAVAG